MTIGVESGPPKVPLLHNSRLRGLLIQLALCAALAGIAYVLEEAVRANLQRNHLASGFAFWNREAGFDISQTLIDYSSSTSTYGQAFWVGLVNTLVVSAIGIVLATIVGFIIGISRLSSNWLVAHLAAGYVQMVRNVPLLLQLLFGYNAVLKTLPGFRDSVALWGGGYLNNRGLYLPGPDLNGNGRLIFAAFCLGLVGAIVLAMLARRRRLGVGIAAGGGLTLVLGLPFAAFVASGATLTFEFPEMSRFNLRGGLEVLPEFVALVTGLVIYTGAFIAETVRAGLLAVPRGQTEAAQALGLSRILTLRRVIVPQAMRVIIPPLTNQYLNLTKNSSLAVAIGYPDLVQIFTGTVLNQTGQAVEIVAVTMAVYLSISLVTAMLMNIYNARMALAER
jgi:general L-amino acid transport system permease protein